jgi:hypothetical protein
MGFAPGEALRGGEATMGPTSTGRGTASTVVELIEPVLAGATGHTVADGRLLEEQLADFAAHRGLPVEDRADRRVVVAPVASLTPALVWTFVADHLPTHVSLPVRRLGRVGRLLERAIGEAAGRGAVDPASAAALADACRRATRTLPRLDRFARALRAHVSEGRPDADLYRRDPRGYAAAMRDWEASRPLADEELEGGFVVREVGADRLVLSHPALPSDIEVVLPREVIVQARDADRIDAMLGRHRDRWFFVDSFAVAAGLPAELDGSPAAG